jgi:hypothetical protein
MLESGDLQRHITHTLLPSYAQRWRALTGAVEKHLGPLGATLPWRGALVRDVNAGSNLVESIDGQQVLEPFPEHAAGGYFIWLTLPAGVDATEFAKQAMEEQNVILQTEAQCRAPISKLKKNKNEHELEAGKSEESASHSNSSVRLCFAWVDEEALVEGIERLAKVLAKFGERDPGHKS